MWKLCLPPLKEANNFNCDIFFQENDSRFFFFYILASICYSDGVWKASISYEIRVSLTAWAQIYWSVYFHNHHGLMKDNSHHILNIFVPLALQQPVPLKKCLTLHHIKWKCNPYWIQIIHCNRFIHFSRISPWYETAHKKLENNKIIKNVIITFLWSFPDPWCIRKFQWST